MTNTVRTLLEDGLYLSVADREYSPVEPDGSQINQALNSFIQIFDAFRQQIPFWDFKTLNGEAELVNVQASIINDLRYQVGNTTYPIKQVTQMEFAEFETVIGLRGLPEIFWFNKTTQTILVYPLADISTRKFIMGFLPLITISNLDQPLPASIPSFFQGFLKYQLASELCDYYTVPWSAKKEASRLFYYEKLLQISQRKPSLPLLRRLKKTLYPIPYLAYLSGNLPPGGS